MACRKGSGAASEWQGLNTEAGARPRGGSATVRGGGASDTRGGGGGGRGTQGYSLGGPLCGNTHPVPEPAEGMVGYPNVVELGQAVVP